jgi:cobalt-precorrin-5B (C1)-methyltransferase
MYMKHLRNKNGRLLRCGYTTGSCAAAAAKAAACVLLSGRAVLKVSIDTPKGVPLVLDVEKCEQGEDFAVCAVRKDSGDDPDVTSGALVFAKVRRIRGGIEIGGGEGVGRVTKPGLDQPVGAAAINSVPRRMIAEETKAAARKYGYEGGFAVTISIPGGEGMAARTFNPKMGIVGGISVIGTSGIVEPMSNRALADTIRLEISQIAAAGKTGVLLTPGNYGEAFARDRLGLCMDAHVNCSNFIGDAVDAAVECGLNRILLVGHIGKLVKLGIGIMNTHSSFGDGRMETLCACALMAGGQAPLLKRVLDCVSTDAALALLLEDGILGEAMRVLGMRIQGCLARRVPEGATAGYICFTNAPATGGVLAQSKNAHDLMRIWRNKK